MNPELPSIGDNELALLRWVASQQDGTTVGEAAGAIGIERGWARTTVLTMMERLRSKGLLERDQAEGVFRYRAASSAREIELGAVGNFVQRALGGSFRPLVAYLVEEAEVSSAELAELEALVATLQARQGGRDEA